MFFFLLCSITSAATISGEVLGPKHPAEKKNWLPNQVKLVLSGQQTTYLDQSNSFSFHNVPDGVYLLEIQDHIFSYKPIFAKVSGEQVTFKDSASYSTEKIAYPLRIYSEKKIVYFEEREGFSVMSILYNPMILVFVLMSLLAFCMPKNSMSQEQMKEMQEMTKQYNSNSWMSSFLTPPSFE